MRTPPCLPEIDYLLTTTKAVRRRLDLTRAVPRELLLECIEIGCFAPNASNAQEWHWIVIDDPILRARVGEQYRKVTVPPVRQMLETKLSRGDEAGARISRSILWLAEHMGDVPAIVIPCYDVSAAEARYRDLIPDPELREQGGVETHAMTSGMYASMLPAVWNFQLALRSRGLGSVLTTHAGRSTRHGRHPRAARRMGPDLPDPRRVHHRGCLWPQRKPVDDVVVWNRLPS